MKKLFLLILLMGSIISNAYAIEIAKQWDKTFGWVGHEREPIIQQTTDGGYIMSGITQIFSGYDILLIKLNSNGDISWQKSYSYGDFVRSMYSIQQTSDGGYILAGFTLSFSYTIASGGWILKLDSNGAIEWQKVYQGIEVFSSIQQTTDGGYVACGGGVVLKLDSNGGVSWQKDFAHISFNSIQQTTEGGYIVAGNYTPSFQVFWLFVVKLDSTGNVIWQKTYGDGMADSIQQTSDGGYVMVFRFGFGLLKLDSNGDVIWKKIYNSGSEARAFSVQQTTDGGYVASGYTLLFGSDTNDLWILRLDGSGNVIWQKTYGGGSGENAKSIQQTSDGGYIVASVTDSFGAGNDDLWVLKLDTNGEIPDCEVTSSTDATVTNISITGQEYNPPIESPDITVIDTDTVPQDTSVETTEVCEYNDPSDTDADGVSNTPLTNVSSSHISEGTFLADEDNCPEMPNGPYLGTCIEGTVGESCICDEACGEGGVCSMDQEDIDGDAIGDVCDTCQGYPVQADSYPPQTNGCGDVCDCEGNVHPEGGDGDVDGSDAFTFKVDFGRENCNEAPFCNGDFECDTDCDGSDAYLFKSDFGRKDCPPCATAASWCSY